MAATSSIGKLKFFWESTFPRACSVVRRRWYEWQLYQVAKVIVAQHGLAVQSGPFRGMQYIPELLSPAELIRHALLPKILGSYEAELHAELVRVIERSYGRVVNIGCSEGYYAIGLSLRLPGARIFAFDLDLSACQFCEQMARLNGVADRVTIEGECTTERLKTLAAGLTLVVCDCEGCELGLLRPDLVPALTACDLIVELHDCVDPSISRVVPDRFAPTHELTLLTKRDRNPSAYPALEQFNPYKRRLAVSEFNWGPPRAWAFLSSRQRQSEQL